MVIARILSVIAILILVAGTIAFFSTLATGLVFWLGARSNSGKSTLLQALILPATVLSFFAFIYAIRGFLYTYLISPWLT